MNAKRHKNLKLGALILGAAFVGACALAVKKKPASVYDDCPDEKNPLEGKRVSFVPDEADIENADGVKGHLEAVRETRFCENVYEKYVKRCLDVVLSFGALVVLAPALAGISLAIKIDDPGPVLFTQKRTGKNKQYFKLHKFRSMKMSTPHDVPTHMLQNPEQYITRVGRFLRAHSLDELPQIWDIFLGNMSIVGPRPSLWNQDLLTAERDKYGANDVRPGLTGWAQINGRDALEIPEKARLDGEYVQQESLLFDAKCLLATASKLFRDESVVEGGTGEMKRTGRNCTDDKTPEEIVGEIGFGESVSVDLQAKKKVLVTAQHSYVGCSYADYAQKHYPENFSVEFASLRGEGWKLQDWSYYDVVFHVAGIAHADIGTASDSEREKYYAVNTDLAVAAAQKAKAEGVKEFILMSSMIVYGNSAPFGMEKVIDKNTVPAPANFYGDSKLQADVAVRSLAEDTFKVAVIRSPMIYGKGSRGNFPLLEKFAKMLPVFPYVENERSMLFVDNLCELLCQLMLLKHFNRNAVVLMPQNAEWTNTSRMVKCIAQISGIDIRELKVLVHVVNLGSKMPGKIGEMVNKAFGNFCYSEDISRYPGLDYQKVGILSSLEPEKGKLCETPLVSVVTICYNSEAVLRKTIESVLNQSYPQIEYIIKDGGSTDATVAIAEEYHDRFAQKGYSYKIISERDSGIYDAMNHGIAAANGELVGIINSGDWYEPEMIQTAVEAFTEKDCDLFFADIHLVRADGSVLRKCSRIDCFPSSRHWNHPTMVVKKSVYDELGAYRCEGIHDDFDFYLRARKAGKRLYVENKVLADFAMGGTSNNKNLSKCVTRCRDRYRCYRNNGYSSLYFLECVAIEAAKYFLVK